MEANKTRGNSKSNKIILGVIILVIVAVVVYAFVSKNKEDKVEVKNQVALTFENINASWARFEGDTRYEINFEYGNEFIYAVYQPGDYMPSTVSIDSTFSINGDVIAITYTVDDVTYSEQYNAAVSADELMLSPVKGSGANLKGTYVNTNSDLYAQYEQQNTQPSSNGNEIAVTTIPTQSENTTTVTTTNTTTTTTATTKKPVSFSLPNKFTKFFDSSIVGLYGYEPAHTSFCNYGCCKIYNVDGCEVCYPMSGGNPGIDGADYVKIKVKDLGYGFDSYTVDDLFELFRGNWETADYFYGYNYASGICVYWNYYTVTFCMTGNNEYADIIIGSPYAQLA